MSAGRDRDQALGRGLTMALVLRLGSSLVEAAVGWRACSLALLADAGPILTDTASLGLAALAAWPAARPVAAHQGHGFGKAERLAPIGAAREAGSDHVTF